MPRRRRPDLGRRGQSNVPRATSRANRTDDQRETDQENSRIAMRKICDERDNMDSSYSTVKVLYNYKYKTKGNYCVSIKKGEKLLLLEKTNNDWWKVERQSDRKFYVPSNYVIEIPQAPSRPSLFQKPENIQKNKPIVKKRTIYTDLHTTSKNFPLKNNTIGSINENITFEKMVCDINQVDIQNNKKVLSPASNQAYKRTIITINHVSDYSVVTIQDDDLNKEQRASLLSCSSEEYPRLTEVNSSPSDTNKSDTQEQKEMQLFRSLEEFDQQSELKLMSSSEITSTCESNTVPNFTEVNNLRNNIYEPSLVSLGNSTDVEKLSRKNKLCHIGNFKTQHERNQWAENVMNRNKIEENKLNDD